MKRQALPKTRNIEDTKLVNIIEKDVVRPVLVVRDVVMIHLVREWAVIQFIPIQVLGEGKRRRRTAAGVAVADVSLRHQHLRKRLRGRRKWDAADRFQHFEVRLNAVDLGQRFVLTGLIS